MRFKRDRRLRLDGLISERSFVKLDEASGRLSLESVRYIEVRLGRLGRVGIVSSAKVAHGAE